MSTARNINSAKPFRRAVEAYRERGWAGTLPLPPRSKKKPPTGYTGHTAPYPSDDDIASWLRMPKYAQGNICLHLGPVETRGPDGERLELIGIDVDDYEEGGKVKEGGKQLAALEAELGPLPKTYTSSSRTGVSGIRFFLVPAQHAWMGKAAPHIDIVCKTYRYAIVFPSWHPGEVDEETGKVITEGGQYKWRDPQGQLLDGLEDIPDVNDLPLLPDAWVERLSRGGMKLSDEDAEIDMDLNVDEMFRWAVGTLPGSDEDAQPCSKMKAAVKYWQGQIEEDASTHDKITGSHWNLACLATEGHTGWRQAMAAVDASVAEDTIKNRGKREISELRSEIMRSKVNALRKLKAQIDKGRRNVLTVCTCYEPSADELDAFTASLNNAKAAASEPTEEREVASGEGRDGYWRDGMPNGTPQDPGDYEQSDQGNGDHWIDLHKDNAFYVPALGQWIMWTGKSWIVGDGCAERSYRRVKARQKRYAEQLMRRAAELKAAQDPTANAAVAMAKSWRSWATRSGDVGPIERALKAASMELGIEESELNANPALICCENGVLELDLSPLDSLADDSQSAGRNGDRGRRNGRNGRNGTANVASLAEDDEEFDLDYEAVAPNSHVRLREIRREDLLTLSTGTNYLPWQELVAGEFGKQEALYASTWARAVEMYLPDEEVRLFLQKLLGYSLLGDNRERIVVFLHGPTGSGKSTFLNATLNALGDYADVVDLGIFKGDRQTNPALAYALPKRIVTCSEASQRNVLHADMFKRITGGDPLTAELKYSNESVKRKPAFVPWIATNTPPSIPGADAAVVDRTVVVGFNEQIRKQDVGMNAMLSSPRAKTAVLAWAVEGWGMYRREGLRRADFPAAVKGESIEFTNQFSDVSEFISECVEEAPVSLRRKAERRNWRVCDWPEEWHTTVSEVYDVYVTWCQENRVADRNIMKKNGFSRQLKDYGYRAEVVKKDGFTSRTYAGFKLSSPNARVLKLQKDS
ncbi:DNA primase/polymerase [Mycobacterium phage Visconti]|uniref:DNA primase/polymerase n=1 Tax=Mycobacterium phage Visconti TaxID=2250387 RepID=A0A2Z5HGJ3_9CAUD|nr:DNA primase/polymerase [Mycobacterium phage Visconti]